MKKSFSKAQQEAFTSLIQKKKAIIEAVRNLNGSSDWKNDAKKVIDYQRQWKEVGYTGKAENRLWADFREACDAFFNARDEANKSFEQEKLENLDRKIALVHKVNDIDLSDKKEALKSLRELSATFASIGPVPHDKKDEVYQSYKTALDKQYSALAVSSKEKEEMAFTSKIESIQASPDRTKLLQKERAELRKQIDRLDQEANRMETNLSFFSRSKGADSLRVEVEQKIKNLKSQSASLKTRLKQLPHE